MPVILGKLPNQRFLRGYNIFMDRVEGRLGDLRDRIKRIIKPDPIEEYLRTHKPWVTGESITIPTGLNEKTAYKIPWAADDGQMRWKLDRNANRYRDELFGDEFKTSRVSLSKGIFEVKPRADRSDVIAGGLVLPLHPEKLCLIWEAEWQLLYYNSLGIFLRLFL